MGRTALLLIAALIALPILALKFDHAPTPQQWQMLRSVGALMLAIAGACFVVGELTGNVSQTDKLWSITPVIYAWSFTAAGGMDPRMVLMSVLATVWGVRLTYNFSRHGGYRWKFWTGHEDYRWAIVRRKPELQGALRWKLFHLFFICFYQHALLFLICLPIVLAAGAERPLGWIDCALASLFAGLVILESAADQQQWNFQAQKKAGNGAARYARGFIADGLWARARHPNYFAEQSIWVTFFLFSVAATGRLNWSMAGCLLLILLFQGSADLKESICLGKYPAYSDYLRRTPRFVPRLF